MGSVLSTLLALIRTITSLTKPRVSGNYPVAAWWAARVKQKMDWILLRQRGEGTQYTIIILPSSFIISRILPKLFIPYFLLPYGSQKKERKGEIKRT